MSSARFTPTPGTIANGTITNGTIANGTITNGTIADQVRRRLLALDYPAFARCVCALLETLGYEDARPAGRREWKGYNRAGGGGYDLEATLPGGLAPRRVVAQIKQFDSLHVHQRSVDEVRGAALRAGAAEALLITTSAFSDVVRKQAASPDPFAAFVVPVRLIDGMELLGLMIRHRLGVRERVRGGTVLLEIDEIFLNGLGTVKSAAAPSTATMRRNTEKLNAEKLKRWRLIVRISSGPVSNDGLSNDGLSNDGLSNDGLSNDGLSNDGLRKGGH